MQHEEILTTIVGADQTSRLEVALSLDAHNRQTLELRRLSWGEGVGWYCQQTLCLGSQEIEDLLQVLRRSQIKWRAQCGRGQGKVIPFPSSLINQEERRMHSLRDVQKKQSTNLASAVPMGEKRGAKQRREESVTSRV
jgi:hypothetical protein